jgi:hypothetical protein
MGLKLYSCAPALAPHLYGGPSRARPTLSGTTLAPLLAPRYAGGKGKRGELQNNLGSHIYIWGAMDPREGPLTGSSANIVRVPRLRPPIICLLGPPVQHFI